MELTKTWTINQIEPLSWFVNKAVFLHSRGHDEVVLDDEAGLLGVQDEPLDDLGRHQPLLRVQVRRRLVDLQGWLYSDCRIIWDQMIL